MGADDRDFNLVNDLFKEIALRCDSDDDYTRLSQPEQVVLLVWNASGIIDNGGFQYFYELTSNMTDVAWAYEELGYVEAAAACRQSMDLFPHSIPPQGHDKRNRLLERRQQVSEAMWEPLNKVLWGVTDQLPARLARYVRSNREAFSRYRVLGRAQRKQS